LVLRLLARRCGELSIDRYEKLLRVFGLQNGCYQPVALTGARFWFEELQLGLGVWSGSYQGAEGEWLRWYDAAGVWIPTEAEARRSAEQQVQEAIPRLASMGLTASQIAAALSLDVTEVEQGLND
jgi:hypothetical protein